MAVASSLSRSQLSQAIPFARFYSIQCDACLAPQLGECQRGKMLLKHQHDVGKQLNTTWQRTFFQVQLGSH